MSEHLRPDKVIQPIIAQELIRLAKMDRNWVIVQPIDETRYATIPKYKTPLIPLLDVARQVFKREGSPEPSLLSMWGGSIWLIDGPKIFRPTQQQQDALAQVSVNLTVNEYRQPYPAILVETNVPPFYATLVFHHDNLLILHLLTPNSVDDIVTTIYQHGGSNKPIEESLVTYDDDCVTLSSQAHKAGRIAINACLALAHFGHLSSVMFAHDVRRDRSLVVRGGKAAGPAARRLETPTAKTTLLSFDQNIKLHDTRDETTARYESEETGREVRTHWRKGHWRRQHHGVGNAEVKTIFIKPVLVRADLFGGSPIITVYKG